MFLHTFIYLIFVIDNISPEYAKYSSDEEEEDEEILGEPFVKEREIDEQEMDKVLLHPNSW